MNLQSMYKYNNDLLVYNIHSCTWALETWPKNARFSKGAHNNCHSSHNFSFSCVYKHLSFSMWNFSSGWLFISSGSPQRRRVIIFFSHRSPPPSSFSSSPPPLSRTAQEQETFLHSISTCPLSAKLWLLAVFLADGYFDRRVLYGP